MEGQGKQDDNGVVDRCSCFLCCCRVCVWKAESTESERERERARERERENERGDLKGVYRRFCLNVRIRLGKKLYPSFEA
jgi:hypothetical protein